MGHEVRHYWHSNIPNAPKDGENVPGSKAPSLSCSPSWRRMRDFGSAGRWIPKISVSSELFPSQAVERVNTTIRLKLFSLRLFLFRPEARPSSSVWKAEEYVFILPSPKSRLLNYYFPGSRDRSQWTRPAFFVKVGLKSPWVVQLPLQRFLQASVPLYNLLKLVTDIFKYVRCGLKIWSLFRVGSIFPSLELRMRQKEQGLTVGRVAERKAVYNNRL